MCHDSWLESCAVTSSYFATVSSSFSGHTEAREKIRILAAGHVCAAPNLDVMRAVRVDQRAAPCAPHCVMKGLKVAQ